MFLMKLLRGFCGDSIYRPAKTELPLIIKNISKFLYLVNVRCVELRG